MNNKIIHLTDYNFSEKVLEANDSILVDFWAEWCGPCKRVSPIIDEIADDYRDKLIVAKLNIDHNPNTVSKYGIRSVPSFLFFQNGKMIASTSGSLSKNQLKEFLSSFLK